jgi:hypothetical protein
MPKLLTASTLLMCPHGGTVLVTVGHNRARASGALLLRAGDTFTIAGCPFAIGPAPHPCVRVQWMTAAHRDRVAGDAALTEASVGLCLAPDNAPQGTVLINGAQPRAAGV